MKVRLANRNDAPCLAELHEQSSAKQPGGFMFRLGRKFLSKYYRFLIDDGSSLILCATDDSGRLIGFVAGALDAEGRMESLKKRRLQLFLASLPALLRHPSLIREVLARQNSESVDESGTGYVVQAGAHEEFWAWIPEHNGGGAIELHLKWLSLMRLLGAETISGEVDKVNDAIMRTHRMLGAKVVKEFVTPDGRERVLIQYRLK